MREDGGGRRERREREGGRRKPMTLALLEGGNFIEQPPSTRTGKPKRDEGGGMNRRVGRQCRTRGVYRVTHGGKRTNHE